MSQNKYQFLILIVGALLAQTQIVRSEEPLMNAIDALVGVHGRDAIFHTERAIDHAKSAVEAGEAGHDNSLVVHSRAALADIKQANRDNDDNPHTKEAIIHLKDAIAEGRKSHTAKALAHTREALSHLELAIH
jgi:hypothetical protein